jgi:hypothetical protein
VTAALEGAGLDEAPPAEALIRLLDAGWAVSARYPVLWHLPPVSPDKDMVRHGPIVERLYDIIRRGQESGDFEQGLPPGWLLAAGLALGRAAEDEVRAGRMSIEEATSVVHQSFLRLFGVLDPLPDVPDPLPDVPDPLPDVPDPTPDVPDPTPDVPDPTPDLRDPPPDRAYPRGSVPGA